MYNSHRKNQNKNRKKNREKPVRCRNRQRAQPTRVLKMWEKMIWVEPIFIHRFLSIQSKVDYDYVNKVFFYP